MNTNLSLTLLVFTLFSTSMVVGQNDFNAIQDVILVNNKPYLVQMSRKGDILSFKKDLKNNYAAISNVKREELFLEDIMIPGGSNSALKAMLAKSDGSESPTKDMAAEKEVKKVDMTIEEKTDDKALAMNDEEVTAKGPSNVNYDYDLAFDHRNATLSFSAVNQLNQIADLLLKNEKANAHVSAFFFESVDISKILSKNRTNAIKEVLILRGVDSDRINITETNNKDWANNRIKVSIH